MDFSDVTLTFLSFAEIALAALVPALVIYFFVPGARGRFLTLRRIRPTSWTGGQVIVAFVLYLSIAPALVYSLLSAIGFFDYLFTGAVSAARKQIWIAPFVLASTLPVLLAFMSFTSGTRASQLGFSWRRWPKNVLLGYVWFLGLEFLTLAIYAFTAQFIQIQVHPLEDVANQSPWLIEKLLLVFAVTVVAPVMEEILFRGLLQGWLQRTSILGQASLMIFTLAIPMFPPASNSNTAPDHAYWGPVVFAIIVVTGYLLAIICYWAPLAHVGSYPLPEKFVARLPDGPTRNARLAIFGSAMFFAISHFDVWPTPIPLFVLGLGLGWLAYRTQSLIPSIVVHALFNAVSCLFLWQNH